VAPLSLRYQREWRREDIIELRCRVREALKADFPEVSVNLTD